MPNDLYGVLHASELKWGGAYGFYTFASDAAQRVKGAGEGRSFDDVAVFREKLRTVAIQSVALILSSR